MVEGPTRILDNSDPSQVDLMFINNFSIVNSCDVLPPIADHCPTILHLQVCSASRQSACSSKRRANIDFKGLNTYLSGVDWSPVLRSNDVNTALSSLEHMLTAALDQFSRPTSGSARRDNKPWFNQYLLRLRRQRDRLFRRSKRLTMDHRLSVAYRKLRNLYVAELRFAEKEYYSTQLCELTPERCSREPHRWWNKAKSICGINSKTHLPTLVVNGSSWSSSLDKAECLNSSFAQQCTASVMNPALPTETVPTVRKTFSFRLLDSDAVQKKLSSLNVWKSTGLDGFSNRLLKECAEVLSPPLAHVFNCSLQSGVFPTVWKQGLVSPVYKNKGSRSNPKNYRPITLLSCISKVFEGFVRDQLQSHCLLNDALPDEQFGFLPKRSAVWQLLSIVNEWEKALDNGIFTHTCFLDMAKAFDRVNHSLLALKLRSVGVYGVELKWFESYLCGRSICTNVDGVQSSMQSISSGVPQGSILGPLLFIIFYRDLPAVSTSKTAMFADDTLIHDCCKGIPAASSSASVCTCSLSRDLQLISDWADEWQTSFNASKTVHMLFRRKHRRHTPSPSPVLLLNSNEIPFAESTRHLGVTLTSTLSWSEHISNIIQRQQFKIFVLKRLARRRGAEDVVKRLYVGVVRPALEYASALWDGCLRRDRIALERVQLAIARSVLRCPRQDRHNWEVLRQIGWPTLAWRRRRNKLLFLWDLLNKQGPPDLASDIPKLASERTDYSLRGPSLAFPRCLTSQRLKSFLPASIELFNSLPASVSSSSSRSSFLFALDRHFSKDIFSFGLT